MDIIKNRHKISIGLILIILPFSIYCQHQRKADTPTISSDNDDTSAKTPHQIEEIWSNILRFSFICLLTFTLWTFLQIGVTPHDVIRGIPFHKYITKISWPLDNSTCKTRVSNTISVTVSFRCLNGQSVKNPLSSGT